MTRSGPAAARTRAVLTLLLSVVALAAFALRTVAIVEPLGIDQSLWASAVRGMADGQRLYLDVWEQRPPGIYWIYLAAFRLFGWTPAAVVWLDVLASAATCLLLAVVAHRLSDALTAAAVAALYATLTMPAWLYGHGGFLERSVCETFIMVCVALAASNATAVARAGSHVAAFGLGLACGAAVVLKPNAGLYFPALLFWIWLYRRHDALSGALAASLVGAAVVPAAAVLWLWRLDLLHEARIAVIDFNRFYVSQGFALSTYALDFSRAVFLRMKTDPLWLAGTVGSGLALWALARRRALPPLAGLAVVWGAAAVIVIVVNGARLFNSYFINGLPPLSLMAGWLLADEIRRDRFRRVLAAATLAGMGFLLVSRGYADRVVGWAAVDYEQLRGRADRRDYLERFGRYDARSGYSARANAELADYIRANTRPEERIFLLGISGAGVYFGSDRLAAHRFLRVNFFVEIDFPDPRFRLDAVLADLEAARPRYLVFERLHGRSAMAQAADRLTSEPAVQALLSAYRLETQIEDFTLYRRSN